MGKLEPDGRSISKWEARTIFLDAIADVTPEVLTDLKNMVMPFLMAMPLFQLACQTADEGELPIYWQDYPEDVKQALAEWAEKYNLTDKGDWIFQTATQSLIMWGIEPETKDDWLHEPVTFEESVTTETDISPCQSGDESLPHALNHMINEMDTKLTATEMATKKNSWSKTDSEIRNDEQYDWLALRIVKDYTAKQIANWRNKLKRPEYMGDTENNIIRGYISAAKRAQIK